MRRILTVLTLLLVPVMLISADRDPGTYSIGGFGGIALPQKPEGFKKYFNSGIGFGGEFKYNINPMTSLGLSYTYLAFKANEDEFKNAFGMMKPFASTLTLEIDPTTVSIISANLIKYLTSPEASAGFYLTLGGGYYMSKSPDIKYTFSDPIYGNYSDTIKGESDNDFGINGGVGLEFKVGEKINLFVVGLYHYVFTSDDEEENGSLAKSMADADDSDDMSGKVQVISIMGGLRFSLGQ
jgi:hypothetical protein